MKNVALWAYRKHNRFLDEEGYKRKKVVRPGANSILLYEHSEIYLIILWTVCLLGMSCFIQQPRCGLPYSGVVPNNFTLTNNIIFSLQKVRAGKKVFLMKLSCLIWWATMKAKYIYEVDKFVFVFIVWKSFWY